MESALSRTPEPGGRLRQAALAALLARASELLSCPRSDSNFLAAAGAPDEPFPTAPTATNTAAPATTSTAASASNQRQRRLGGGAPRVARTAGSAALPTGGTGSVGGTCRPSDAAAAGGNARGAGCLRLVLSEGGGGVGSRVAHRSRAGHSAGAGGKVGSSSSSSSPPCPGGSTAGATQAAPCEVPRGKLGSNRAATSFASRRPLKVRTPLSSHSPRSPAACTVTRSARPSS